jgi:hypothetical protein
MTYISHWKAVGENINDDPDIRALAPARTFFLKRE